MSSHYQPQTFWNERFSRFGHTGEVDAVLYAYDQPQRLRAIEKTLARAGVVIGDKTKILDFGCGAGDMVELFLKHGRPDITAIDISDETIRHVQHRFAGHSNVKAMVVDVQDIEFPPGSFDLVVGINVLQHIVDDHSFERAVKTILRVTQTSGHIMTMDFSPVRVKNRYPAPYVIIRSRQEYLDAFANNGGILIGEFGLPRIGVRLYRATYRLAARLAIKRRRSMTTAATMLSPLNPSPASTLTSRLNYLMETLILKLAQPFDYALAPLPAPCTDMRILLFEKHG